MRIGAWIIGASLAGIVGCLAPFKWPDERSLPTVPVLVESPADSALERAADLLERGDSASALPHFRTYLTAFPEAVAVRFQLAELLFRLNKPHDARAEFETCLAGFASSSKPMPQLVQCHTRLMALAEDRGDDFGEHLHRGIGLYLLVRRWDADSARRDEVAAEQTLSQALDALAAAARLRPGDAAVAEHRALILDRLGLPSAAIRWTSRPEADNEK